MPLDNELNYFFLNIVYSRRSRFSIPLYEECFEGTAKCLQHNMPDLLPTKNTTNWLFDSFFQIKMNDKNSKITALIRRSWCSRNYTPRTKFWQRLQSVSPPISRLPVGPTLLSACFFSPGLVEDQQNSYSRFLISKMNIMSETMPFIE